MRYLLLLVIGVSAGYALGFRDARQHDKSIVERIIDRVQNANESRMGANADKQLDDLEHH